MTTTLSHCYLLFVLLFSYIYLRFWHFWHDILSKFLISLYHKINKAKQNSLGRRKIIYTFRCLSFWISTTLVCQQSELIFNTYSTSESFFMKISIFKCKWKVICWVLHKIYISNAFPHARWTGALKLSIAGLQN